MINSVQDFYQYFTKETNDNWDELLSKRPHLLAPTQITIKKDIYLQIIEFIELYERIALNKLNIINSTLLPKNSHRKLKTANIINDLAQLPGIFYSFDFHLNEQQTKLIEVNTNAGGIFINSVLAHAWQNKKIANSSNQLKENTGKFANRQQLVDVFLQEWQLHRINQPLKVIAIVDENPTEQYLYPEFLLCQSWLNDNGYTCLILAPEQLQLNDNQQILITENGTKIDFIYNRLTDFTLNDRKYTDLITAYQADAIVLSPNPSHYQIMANKNILSELSINCINSVNDENSNTKFPEDLTPNQIKILERHLPITKQLNTQLFRSNQVAADELWKQRKKWFFKPQSGFGGQAVYRGDKMTKKVFNEILLRDDYLVQEYVPPGEHHYLYAGENHQLKYDLRCYRSHGKTLGLSVRLYQGQTTNFRSVAGGFAVVLVD